MKISTDGEMQWFKIFEQSPVHCFVEGLVEDSDGDYVVYGRVDEDAGDDTFLICLDDSGRHIYTKIFDLGYRRAKVKKK